MATANLHTLDSDILFGLLATSTDLVSLRCLILSHRALYHAFNDSRRLILRTVFKTQNNVHPLRRLNERDITAAEKYINRLTSINAIDRVALREALWPALERTIPAKTPSKWATTLLACYNKAELRDDALSFAKRTMGLILASPQPLHTEHRIFARAVIRTYMAAKMPDEAIELEETILRHLAPRSPDHSIWAKQLLVTYQDTGHAEKILPLQLASWELYRQSVGSGSEVALDWARSITRGYQLKGEHEKAIEFHQTVWNCLDPTTQQYVAWSRQLIHWLQKSNQHGEALVVTEQVWHHLQPNARGYRPWAAQLADQYEAAGRPEMAVAVSEAVWAEVLACLTRFPNDASWKYQARGAGLKLARAYRLNQRGDEATALEAKCREISI
ncbi:hypothetical protein P153DRAFT_355953 [Dothidotthia symphoricarpi CBS 119687]|uniref:Uncharacterized protein n=1 Tax=Dothidotthia symphoricarpi CBS 119687 TaxID=1392245 RepID=A0A6A6AJB6_9PLEO|nr:uncharacterized protein P153DRAFT_355953 [Dothidotthia symphoricarpi CBS 119687]KAF2131198.1 hypothetical protein P153DRAFT_355953 [Dothidotthia symphoricarpi CBS 119687]